MITGFNTDIEHDGVTYHVQTEDKGLDTPLILSLVYDRGTILASKRSPYDDLIRQGFDEKILTERLQKQHKLMCAAVRAGRIEELIQMTAKAAGAAKAPKDEAAGKTPAAETAAKKPKAAPAANGHAPDPHANGRATGPIPRPTEIIEPEENGQTEPPRFLSKSKSRRGNSQAFHSKAKAARESFAPAIPAPKEELVWDLPLKIVEDDYVVEVKTVLDDAPMISMDAVEIIPELNQSTAARVKLPALAIEFMNETTFRAGERKTLQIRVFRGAAANSVAAAQVMVKVLGSSFRPLIFHAKTDSNGVAVVHLQLPQFRAGRGAVLVRAIHAGEEAELRQIIRQS